MSKRTEDQISPIPPDSLSTLSDSDLRHLTGLLTMPPQTHPQTESGQQWLKDQEAQLKSTEFPEFLKRPRGLVDRLRLNWTVHHAPFCPQRATLCRSHRKLDPRIVRQLMLLVADECTLRIDRYRHLRTKRKLDPLIEEWLKRLDDLTILWLGRDIFEQTYERTAPHGVVAEEEHCKCEACILAAIGGNPVFLADLRTSVLGRFSYARNMAKTDMATPRLLRVLGSWMQSHDAVIRHRILTQSYALAPHVAAVRRLYHDRVRARMREELDNKKKQQQQQQQQQQDGRRKTGKTPGMARRSKVRLTKKCLPIPRIPRNTSSARQDRQSRQTTDPRGGGGYVGAGAGWEGVRRFTHPVDGAINTVAMDVATPRLTPATNPDDRGVTRVIRLGDGGKVVQVESWMDGVYEPADASEPTRIAAGDDCSDVDSASEASDLLSEEQAHVKIWKKAITPSRDVSTRGKQPSQPTNDSPANHLHIYNKTKSPQTKPSSPPKTRPQNPFVSRNDYIAPLNPFIIRRNKRVNNPYEFDDGTSASSKASQDLNDVSKSQQKQQQQQPLSANAFAFDGVNRHTHNPYDDPSRGDHVEAVEWDMDALGFAVEGYNPYAVDEDGVSWMSVTPLTSPAPSLRSVSVSSNSEPEEAVTLARKPPEPRPTDVLKTTLHLGQREASSIYSPAPEPSHNISAATTALPFVRRASPTDQLWPAWHNARERREQDGRLNDEEELPKRVHKASLAKLEGKRESELSLWPRLRM